ncbi:MAG: (4Fe-4S)-binding protein [Bacteroidia bacterium]|nr:(4Fe-4S)-binding protein [Bacteroidia bacterium]
MDRKDKQFSGGRRYRNDEITVYWKPSACVHASYCYRELIEVFDPSRRPWVDMNGSTTAKIIEVVNLCPTEALAWKWNDDEKNGSVGSDQLNHIKFRRPELMNTNDSVPEEHPVSIKVMVDGPIVLKGNFTLAYNGNKKEVQESIISICRCRASDHQPFCDGQHRKIGFNG